MKWSSKTRHVPNGASSGRGDGVPLLGMAKLMKEHAAFNRLFLAGRATWAQSPNAKPIGEAGAKRVQGLREAVEKAG